MHLRSELPLRTLTWALVVVAVAAYMLLSAQMLLRLGVPYDAPFGSPLAKLHPGTYCLLLAWFTALASHGNPLRGLVGQMMRHGLFATYLACMLWIFVWVIFRHGASGAAFIVESLWMPAIAAFTLYLLDSSRHRQIVQIMVLLLTCNAVLAIGEVLTATRLTPLHVGLEGIVPEAYFRASAFLGHPLHNALITVSLLPAVTMLPWSLPRRLMIILLLILSLLAFGGRTSLGLGLLVYGGYAVYRLGLDIGHGRYSYLQLTGGSLAVMLMATGLVGVAAATGLGERIFHNLKFDASASVRLQVWDVFHYMSADDLWIGLAPNQIDHILLRIGVDPIYEALENFWISLFMQFGVIGFIPFIVGLVCLVAALWKISTPPMRAAVLLYFLVASTANTLSSKTASLTLLVIAIVAGTAFRRRDRRLPTVGPSIA